MRVAVAKLAAIGTMLFSVAAYADVGEPSPEKVKIYVETLRSLKAPIDGHELAEKLKPIFEPSVAINVGFQGLSDKRRQYPLELQGKYATIRMSFPLDSKKMLEMPSYNVLAPSGEAHQILNCGSDAKWFENLRIGDLVKMYGPWTLLLDGTQSKHGTSLFTFKSGDLEIDVSGCYRATTEDIRVHMLSVKWPKPEWDKYYK